MVLGGHVKIARLRGVMRCLLRDIVGAGIVRQVPIAREDFAEDRVEGFFDSPFLYVSKYRVIYRVDLGVEAGGAIRWSNMPSAKIKFDDRDKTFDRIFDMRDREEHFRMAHEAIVL